MKGVEREEEAPGVGSPWLKMRADGVVSACPQALGTELGPSGPFRFQGVNSIHPSSPRGRTGRRP